VRHWRLGSSGGGACGTGCSSANAVGGKHVRSSVEAFGDGKCNGEPLLATKFICAGGSSGEIVSPLGQQNLAIISKLTVVSQNAVNFNQ
jgi:hypothetical protein